MHIQFDPSFSNLTFTGTEIIITAIFGVLFLLTLGMHSSTRSRMRKLLKGTKALSIEDTLVELIHNVEDLETFRDQSIALFKKTNARIATSIRAVETRRYNAFQGMGTGGNQSFTSVFSDEKGNGLILTGLYSSESMRVFAKPMIEFKSQFELTEEEKEAVSAAHLKVGSK